MTKIQADLIYIDKLLSLSTRLAQKHTKSFPKKTFGSA